MNSFLTLCFLVFIGVSQTKWDIDKSHTSIGFTVGHMVISEVDGRFDRFEGSINSTKEDFTDARIEFNIEIKSINTGNEKRDGHLRSGDFFAADEHPQMIFKSKHFNKVVGKNYKLIGDLTIRGVTKAVEFDVEYKGTVESWGRQHAAFVITGEVNRMDYGVKWNKTMDTGGLLVGETVALNIKIELINAK